MGNENSTSSYLVPPQLHGKLNSDGTYSLSALELKALNDYNYYVAKMIQGGLNLANLNKETNETFNGMVTFTDLSTGGSTTINGDNITTGTISADRVSGGTLEGVELISRNPTYNDVVDIINGAIYFKRDNTALADITPTGYGVYINPANGNYIYLTGNVQVGMYGTVSINGTDIGVDGSAVRLASSGNTSINSSGTTYIGTNASYSGNVDIGQVGGTIHLVGDVYINGVLQ